MAKDPSQRSPREYFCSEILRLPPGKTDPDHYTLLGLGFFEKDHGTIVRAAMDRVRLLESCLADTRPGHQKVVQELLARVRQAQITLLDASRRQAYDATMIGHDESAGEEPEPVDDEIELRPGTMVVGRYRILGERRRGGFGIVYNALDSNMRTRVELSVLRPRLSEHRRSRRRAERAARAAAALDHVNILRADEVGDADGLLFVRTRQVEGKNLLEAIEATPKMRMDPERVRGIVRQIASGLQYAHEREVTHGDLRPHSVFLTDDGRALVADFCLSRATLDELGDEAPRTRAPENEDTPAADLFALGCLAYQMLAGMPPFAAGVRHYVPRPLPDDVPEDLEVLVTRLLARDPAQRPANASEVVDRLAPRSRALRLPALLGAAAVFGIALVAALVGAGGKDEEVGRLSVREEAWKLIADKRFDEAIEKLRAAHASDPADDSLNPSLADALDRKAATLGNDPWSAQQMLEEAEELAPQPERQVELERVRAKATEALAQIAVTIDACTDKPIVRVEGGAAFVASVSIAGLDVPMKDGVAGRELQLFDGPHEIPYVLVDRVGNRREGSVATIVDTKAPTIRIVEPEDGEFFSNGEITFKAEVEDANLPEAVSLRGRPVRIENGVASDLLRLPDGEHVIEVRVRDRAGHEARAASRVVVDSKVPQLKLATRTLATRDGRATVRGSIKTSGASVQVDGKPVEIAADGSFHADVSATDDRHVPVEAVGPTGLKKKLSVLVRVDRDPPAVKAFWERRDQKGVLLYGGRELDAGEFRVRIVATDKTGLQLVPSEGTVRDGHWILEAREGARTATLAVEDEAGNRTTLALQLEGHRSTPKLVVSNNTPEHTNAEEAVLDIEADDTLFVQGKEAEPGRLKIPLPEGRFRLDARAVDRYGNEARWRRDLHVDRTPPQIKLSGELERGVGRQELRFDADEDIASVTCFGKTQDVKGRSARVIADLKPGRRRLTVLVKDLAGNAARETYQLVVVNKVLLLDGKSAVSVVMPDVVLETFTIEFWVRGTAKERATVVLSRGPRTDFVLYWGRENQSLPYAAVFLRETGFTSLPARKAWRWDRWTHVALCFDGAKVRFFVNGAVQHTIPTKNPLIAGKSPLLVGGGPDSRNRPSYFFTGALDEVRLSKVARYARGFSPPRHLKDDDDTLVFLRFDTMVGDRFADTSGHDRHAVAIGTPQLQEESR